MASAKGKQGHQITGLPIEMHSNHGPKRPLPRRRHRPSLQQMGQVGHGKHGAIGLQIHEHRASLDPQHGSGGGVGGVGRQQDPIPGFHAGGPQGQLDGIGAIGHTHHLVGLAAGPQPGGKGGLKLPHPFPQNHLARCGDPLHGLANEMAVAQELLLGEIEGVAHGLLFRVVVKGLLLRIDGLETVAQR